MISSAVNQGYLRMQTVNSLRISLTQKPSVTCQEQNFYTYVQTPKKNIRKWWNLNLPTSLFMQFPCKETDFRIMRYKE